MSVCVCGHQSDKHGTVTYPVYREPCKMCASCGRLRSAWGCCNAEKPCGCSDFVRAVDGD